MQNSEINPFDLYFDKNCTSELEKDHLYRQLIGFLQYKQIADMMVRLFQKKPNEQDFELRDIINTGLFQEERKTPNFFYYGKKNFKEMKSVNSLKIYEKVYDECMLKKKDFWEKYSKIKGVTREQVETRDLVKRSISSYVTPYRISFFLFSTIVCLKLNLYMNRPLYTGILLTTGIWLGGNMSRYKNSSRIFNDIPRLPDPEIESERQNIVNSCFLFDTEMVSKLFLSHTKKNQKKQENQENSENPKKT